MAHSANMTLRPMRRLLLLLFATTLLAACTTVSGPPTEPNDREWNLITADYAWIETLRKAQPPLPPNASRKQMIELDLENHRKIDDVYTTFMAKVGEYYERTHDVRAAKVIAREKILVGDDYMNVLARYDRALDLYRQALAVDPQNADARQRVAYAEERRFVSMSGFANVKNGMKEDDVRRLVGLPREDWIKQVEQNSRLFSVWIYPKSDGGAAAIYFDNGVVYHTNWNAAAPAASQTK
jgi:tetratricopeptide (TPR) repeat protein